MEVAAYAPYRQHTFQPDFSPHYGQYHESRTSHPASVHPVVAGQYQDVRRAGQRQAPQQHSAASAVATSQDDMNKPSLPSISNLLGIADGERSSNQETGSPLQQQQVYYSSAPTEFSQGYVTVVDPVSTARGPLPPSPPAMRSDSVVETAHSPTSMAGQSYFLGSSMNNVEPHHQRTMSVKRHSVPMPPSGGMYTTSPYAMAAYNSSPSAMSTSSYYSADGVYGVNGVYQQRPLPSNFPPVMTGPVISASSIPAPNMWEHHHYIAPSSQATYPQSQDRYVCQTCNKAFSRPSSLKIHNYSHTGEKPFKCMQPGCGKAFSVRSNMKRHERGCHAGSSNIMA